MEKSRKEVNRNLLQYGEFYSAKVEDSAFLLTVKDEEKSFEKTESVKVEKKSKQKKSSKSSEKGFRVRHSIGLKLIAIISAIVVIAMGSITVLVSYFVSEDVRTSAEENNMAINSRTASDTQNRISTVVSSVNMFLELLKNTGSNETEQKTLENLFFDRNKSIAAVYFPFSERLFANSAFFITHEIEKDSVQDFFKQENSSVDQSKNGVFEILNASAFFNVPMLAFIWENQGNSSEDVTAVLFSVEELSESFSSGSVNQSFLVNNEGTILIHSNLEYMMSAADFSENPIVLEMLENSSDNSQISYTDDLGKEYIGAYRKLSFGNGGVITLVKTAVILEGVQRTTRRNIYITIALLALVIIIIYFFAQSLSVPLKILTAIVNEINTGNFNTSLFSELKTNRSDEIGALASSTKNEREILNTFTKLTNKGVTEAVLKKEIDFEPHLKDVTIFFSDIRGFTAISDGFKNRFGERSAAEIINFLNDYMSRMVACIKKTGGTVDKFEGDAIMAAWGVLRNETLDWETMEEGAEKEAARKNHERYVKEDALNAITCCVAMRYSLMKYNKDAYLFTKEHKSEPLAQYKPFIKIGTGLNSGRATVGFMGSYDKMEFTSIGDAVNFASRTEASNKPCGTDILITQDTYDILKKDYIKCPENGFFIEPQNSAHEIIVEKIPVDFEVKGKGKQHFYGVVNMPNFDIEEFFADEPGFELDTDCARVVGKKGPRTLSMLRKLLGIAEPDFGRVNLNEEENKVQVAHS